MRKIKLQVQISVDGFVGRPDGGLDWMMWDWDDGIKKYVDNLHNTVDTILLGRKMTDGFVKHWTNLLTKPDDEGFEFAKKMVDYPKYVFTKTLDRSEWANTELAKGPLAEEVNKLKKQNGKDIIVYGGAGFVTNLIKEGLVDEYYLFRNPVAIGKGLTIFGGVNDKLPLKLSNSISFDCGIVLSIYTVK